MSILRMTVTSHRTTVLTAKPLQRQSKPNATHRNLQKAKGLYCPNGTQQRMYHLEQSSIQAPNLTSLGALVGMFIAKMQDVSTNMRGALDGMGEQSLPIISAVSATKDNPGIPSWWGQK